MSFTEADVERIVSEVIRRLRAMDSSAAAAAPAPVGHDLVLTERVITMRTIDGQLGGVQRLLVPAKAVVTPAVRDELKQRKIELVR
ncbi:MAG TPA: hypothetical protein VFB96_07695 [Pirellulaceae bacterium]|jgi:hypothetical protein|nr:hypothetical protein [Pirellulaceae bacterium]